jgi:hypothetical protein
MQEYQNYEKLIKKISWSWHKTTGIELETLIAEANLAFAECQNNHNPKRGKFSTLLYHAIESHFKNIITKQHIQRYDGVEISMEDIALTSKYNQEKECILRDTISKLSKEAREIISIVFDAPADLIAMLPKPRLNKHRLTKYLRLKGWKIPAILRTFNEIKKALE